MSPIEIGPDGTPIVTPNVPSSTTDPISPDTSSASGGQTSFVAPPVDTGLKTTQPVVAPPIPTPTVTPATKAVAVTPVVKVDVSTIRAHVLDGVGPILKRYGMDTQQQGKAIVDIAELFDSLA